jgi:hypothetical protein
MKETYRGSCHCGKVKFEVDMDLDHVRVCDCSLCRKRGVEGIELESIPIDHVYGSKLE